MKVSLSKSDSALLVLIVLGLFGVWKVIEMVYPILVKFYIVLFL